VKRRDHPKVAFKNLSQAMGCVSVDGFVDVGRNRIVCNIVTTISFVRFMSIVCAMSDNGSTHIALAMVIHALERKNICTCIGVGW
jgi:hypothetical protein